MSRVRSVGAASGGILELNKRQHGRNLGVLKARIEAFKDLPCEVPYCDDPRQDASVYCRSHRAKYRKSGHPTLTAPPEASLQAIEKVISEWLQEFLNSDEGCKRNFKQLWGAGVISLRRNPRYAVPFFTLEGQSGFTNKSKASIMLAWYEHKQGNPLGAVLLRWMAVRLWAELYWYSPPGKFQRNKELNYFVNTRTGMFVVRHAGFSKEKTQTKIIGWEKDPLLNIGTHGDKAFVPIKETKTIRVTLPAKKASAITRAIGREVKGAVDHAMGKTWHTNPHLQFMAADAVLSLNGNDYQRQQSRKEITI